MVRDWGLHFRSYSQELRDDGVIKAARYRSLNLDACGDPLAFLGSMPRSAREHGLLIVLALNCHTATISPMTPVPIPLNVGCVNVDCLHNHYPTRPCDRLEQTISDMHFCPRLFQLARNNRGFPFLAVSAFRGVRVSVSGLGVH